MLRMSNLRWTCSAFCIFYLSFNATHMLLQPSVILCSKLQFPSLDETGTTIDLSHFSNSLLYTCQLFGQHDRKTLLATGREATTQATYSIDFEQTSSSRNLIIAGILRRLRRCCSTALPPNVALCIAKLCLFQTE